VLVIRRDDPGTLPKNFLGMEKRDANPELPIRAEEARSQR